MASYRKNNLFFLKLSICLPDQSQTPLTSCHEVAWLAAPGDNHHPVKSQAALSWLPYQFFKQTGKTFLLIVLR
jgi:hypothetical protein